jgi:hypothetical protein
LSETESKAFKRLQGQAFACEADATAALQAFCQTLKLTEVHEPQIIASPRRKRGRPGKNQTPATYDFRVRDAEWRVIVPTRVRMHLYTTPWIIEWLRHTFMPDWATLTRQSTGLRLYLSRDKASKRQVINEAEVVAMLQEYGFQVLHLETLSITAAARLYDLQIGQGTG